MLKTGHLGTALRGGLFTLTLIASAVGAAQAQTASTTQAAPWPERQIRIVVPFPAGGATDVVARIVAQQAGTELGQQVVVENKSGAGGTIGAGEAAKAAADGYTILLTTSSTP